MICLVDMIAMPKGKRDREKEGEILTVSGI